MVKTLKGIGAVAARKRFEAVIEGAVGGGAFIKIPFDVEKYFGKKRVKVKATFDGEPYRGSVVRYGGTDHMLIVRKEIREKIGKNAGDTVEVVLEEDTEPRVLELPSDFTRELRKSPQAEMLFNKLSYTHQNEYLTWIEEAKKGETRVNRIKKAIEMIREGKKEQ